MKKILKPILVALSLIFTGFANAQTSDVVDVAISSKDHTTLVAAVKAADLVTTLKSKGPFTVFAPSNSAFDKLPKGTVENLLKPESKEALVKLLTYHVVAGNLKASDVLAAIKAGKGKAVVTATDLTASNGVVHVIDSVVMPK